MIISPPFMADSWAQIPVGRFSFFDDRADEFMYQVGMGTAVSAALLEGEMVGRDQERYMLDDSIQDGGGAYEPEIMIIRQYPVYHNFSEAVLLNSGRAAPVAVHVVLLPDFPRNGRQRTGE